MIYQFSSITLDSETQGLSIGAKPVNADPRIIQLLIYLAQRHPKISSKSELLAQLWPDTVVSDWSVSKLISDTRLLFKQNDFNDEIIQTLHGRGYRLEPALAAQLVSGVTSAKNSQNLDFQAPKASQPKLSKRWPVLVLLILTMASVGWLMSNDSAVKLTVSEPPNSVGRLLWVDDNPQNNDIEKTYFEQKNITVYQVRSSEEALTSLALYEYSAVISDMGREGEVLAGLNLLKAMREQGNQTPFILYTIVLTDAQQALMEQHKGQGVAVESTQLYELVVPYFVK